jgi:hypothetical protein
MQICIFGQLIELTVDMLIAITALFVSIIALAISIFFWRRSFRPIVTAMVKTHAAGNQATLFDLELLNSGALPAKNVRLFAKSEDLLAALGSDSGEDKRRRWFSCFEPENTIDVLHNGKSIRCSFGLSRAHDAGFWRYRAEIPITIEYEGWFGKRYWLRAQYEVPRQPISLKCCC